MLTVLAACTSPDRESTPVSTAPGGAVAYVGSGTCRGCHSAEHEAWAGSAHAAAARLGQDESLRTRFDDVPKRLGGFAFRPQWDAAGGWVEWLGDGTPSRLDVPLVLGVREVEQPVVLADRGRLPALPVGYDPERGEWFDIFPEAPAPTAWAHWRQPGMTANTRCLMCHTTGISDEYDAASDTYCTRWAALGVGCEACHGPAGGHVATQSQHQRDDDYGRVGSRTQAAALCAPCHTQGSRLSRSWDLGRPLDDLIEPLLLDAAAYSADGQAVQEVFEGTSFALSRKAGRVECFDCHDPHSGRLRAEGDALCVQCHGAGMARAAHTHHPVESDGARCVSCHMPQAVYMERDARRDHRFIRPDPRVAAAIQSRDVCRDCHASESPEWAVWWRELWWPPSPETLRDREVALALDAGRRGRVDAVPGLLGVAERSENPIARASALRLLTGYPDADVGRVTASTPSDSPLVRAARVGMIAGRSTGGAPPHRVVVDGLRDASLLVRAESVWALRGVRAAQLPAGDREARDAAVTEWLTVQRERQDDPEAMLNLGVFLEAQDDVEGADLAYRTSLRQWAAHEPARYRLALLLARTGRLVDAERELDLLLEKNRQLAPALFSRGLLRAHHGRLRSAADDLIACVAVDPAYPRAEYQLGRLLEALDDPRTAIPHFERAVADPQSRRDALHALVLLGVAAQDRESVARWLPEAIAADPGLRDDPRLRGLLGKQSEEGRYEP